MDPLVGDLIFKVVMPVLFGVVGYLLVDLRTSVKEQLRTHDEQLRETRDQLGRLEADLPVQYVRREEFIRQSVQVERKLDRVLEALAELQHRRRREDSGWESSG
jgi:chromosome segregation ATPase